MTSPQLSLTPATGGFSSSNLNPSQTPQSRNPVALRLYKVLNTNFDNEETRQALQTLSDIYASPKSKEVLDVATVIDITEEDAGSETTHAPATHTVLVENAPGELAARARKNLRRDVENKLVDTSKNFLEALGEVDLVSRCDVALSIRLTSAARNFVNYKPI